MLNSLYNMNQQNNGMNKPSFKSMFEQNMNYGYENQ